MYKDLRPYDAEAITALVDAVLSHPGHTVSVHDSEVWVVRKSRDRDEILANMGETELDDIRVRDEDANIVGWFRLIYGNGQGETLCDYSANEYCKAIAERVNA